MTSHVDGRIKLCPSCRKFWNVETRKPVPELEHIRVENVTNKELCGPCEEKIWAETTNEGAE